MSGIINTGPLILLRELDWVLEPIEVLGDSGFSR
jgi:hypothetical protein